MLTSSKGEPLHEIECSWQMNNYKGKKNVGTFGENLFLFNIKSFIILKANRSSRGKLMKCGHQGFPRMGLNIH